MTPLVKRNCAMQLGYHPFLRLCDLLSLYVQEFKVSRYKRQLNAKKKYISLIDYIIIPIYVKVLFFNSKSPHK